MNSNIISAVMQVLTPDMIGKVASASGIADRSVAQNAITAAVPAILAGIANIAKKPDGARQLSDAIVQQSPRTLENLATSIGGTSQLADTGKSMLSSLFGSGGLAALATAVGKFAGVGDGAMRTILGMISPVILGVLGREAGSGANGLTQLLASQQDNIAAALPAGLSSLLRSSGFTGQAEAATSAATARVHDTYRTAKDSVGEMARSAAAPLPPAAGSNWAYWALGLLALAGLVGFLMSGDRTDTATVGQQQGVAVSDVSTRVATAVNALNTSLQGVQDRATAMAALPKVQQTAVELERLREQAMRLPVQTRSKVAEAVKTAGAQLAPTLDRLSGIPEVPQVMRPAIMTVLAKLDDLVMLPAAMAR